MSLDVVQALLVCDDDYANLGDVAVKYMREIGRLYPLCGYGGMFRE